MKLLQTRGIPFRLSDSTRHQLGLYALVAASIVGFGFLTLANPLFAASTERVYSFSGADGIAPDAELIRDASGNFYGVTAAGGLFSSNCNLGQYLGCGTVFQLTPGANGTWEETVLYEFKGSPDGTAPETSLVLDHDGNLYGTTVSGGAGWNLCASFGCGIVFRLRRDANGNWIEEVLHNFNGNDGGNPVGKLIFDADGNLYGTASQGGLCYSCGTVFELTPNASGGWKYTVLHYFSVDGVEGSGPGAGLTFDAAGNLYGTTLHGGAYGWGNAFEMKLSEGNQWAVSVLHSFNENGNDGYSPSGGLIFDQAGNLYGTTASGGQAWSGTAYRLKPGTNGEWTEEILYNFCSVIFCLDGGPPIGLSSDADGNLYGTTLNGGLSGYGIVFELTQGSNSTWIEMVLHTFIRDGEDGIGPNAGVMLDSAGNVYGTTAGGGTGCKQYHGCGTIFEITR